MRHPTGSAATGLLHALRPDVGAVLLCLLAALAAPAAHSALFDAPVALPVSYRPSAAELRDLDGDGDLDLAALCMGEFANDIWNGFTLHVFANPGDGAFYGHDDYVVPSAPCGLAIADLNGDTHPDLATANAAPDNLQVLLNDGVGGFSASAPTVITEDHFAALCADCTGDDYPDLILPHLGAGVVTVLAGGGGGTFTEAHCFATGIGPRALALGDFNGDGGRSIAGDPRRDRPLCRLQARPWKWSAVSGAGLGRM